MTNLEVTVRQGTRRIGNFRTDPTGEYRGSIVTAEGGAPLELQAMRGDLGGGESGLRLTAGEVRRLDLALKPTRLAGRLVGADSRPRQGVRVELAPAEGDRPAVTNSVSDARGEFRFGAAPPGQYVLRAITDDSQVLFANGQPVVMNWGTVKTNLEFKLPAATALQSRAR